ncbi:MFS transporter [Achromobacter xylosoxidans]
MTPVSTTRGQAWLIGLLMALVTLTPMGIDIYLPSLPGMAQDFGVTMAAMQTSVTLFIFAVGLSQLLIGPLADRHGRAYRWRWPGSRPTSPARRWAPARARWSGSMPRA